MNTQPLGPHSGIPLFHTSICPVETIRIFGQLRADHRLYNVFLVTDAAFIFSREARTMSAKKEKKFTELSRIRPDRRSGRHIPVAEPPRAASAPDTSGEMTIAVCTDTEHHEGKLDKNVVELAHDADLFFLRLPIHSRGI